MIHFYQGMCHIVIPPEAMNCKKETILFLPVQEKNRESRRKSIIVIFNPFVDEKSNEILEGKIFLCSDFEIVIFEFLIGCRKI